MGLRKEVLSALKAGQGEWVSGEALSQRLQVSRTAIWKQIQSLAAEGYVIESSPRKGYRINKPADLLSPEEVLPELPTKIFAREQYIYWREIDSTNKYAKTLAARGYPEGTVVITEQQTAGQGRRGRSWYSPAHEGIYFSLILRPLIPLSQISRISLLCAVATAEALREELGIEARIKWPNDILVNQKKIAGILAEAVTDMDRIEYLVLGIGININTEQAEFPDDFRTPPSSVSVELKQPVSRIKVLHKLLLSLEKHYLLLQGGNFVYTLARARQLSLVIGKQVNFEDGLSVTSGQAIDFDENGFLLVKDQHGKIHTVMSGEITLQ